MTKKETINQYIDKNNCLDILLLQKSELNNLHKLAKELEIENYNQLKEIMILKFYNPNMQDYTIQLKCLEMQVWFKI